MRTAAVARESAPHARAARAAGAAPLPASQALPETCPLSEAATMRAHRAALQAGSDLSLRFQAFLQGKAPGDLGEWLQSVMAHSRSVFQPWSMEILFLAGIQGSARFSTLESMLGISSRTLSDKLSGLVEAGLLERIVEPGPPLRTSYRLSRHGRATVAAASPLFSHLTLASVRPQAALPP